ncbi:MAG: peptidase domain-containing ABC transporter [Bacteroidetes bacterium]|nr:peptidase domain-containing ABC transporter [Bacteroidota bacterium]
MLKSFPFQKQLDQKDCGPTCVSMISKYYGKTYPMPFLRERAYLTREGVNLLGISDLAESIGFRTLGVRVTFEQLADNLPLPCIAHWRLNHFVVVHKIKKDKVYVADPAHGMITYTKEEFKKYWVSLPGEQGVLLLFETTPEFHEKNEKDIAKDNKRGFSFLFKYLLNYKKYFIQLFIGLLVGTLLQLILPFLTQSLVDYGVGNQNINFVYMILIAQLVLTLSSASVEFIRSWILLHISSRINISIVSDFLAKLMRLPISYFDAKMTGDIMQRIGDHSRIEQFMTSSTLNTLFSMINFIVFGVIMAYYSMKILTIFFIGSILYALWVVFFLRFRKELDYKRFSEMSENQNNMIQLIGGMQEIKLQNCERQKRWEWEHIQVKLFKLSVRGLTIGQYQQAGSLLINELKNIIISFISAKEVIDGNMTLGMMMSVSYILGQLNMPINQLIGFIQSAQDAKMSLERLSEIHNKEDEETPEQLANNIFPENKSLQLNNVAFQYEGKHSEMVLKNVNVHIPEGKVTAIVGTSGSGKTTILKMLLKFYKPAEGEIKVGDINLENFSSSQWRRRVGVVMQDGFIFSDTIAKNIAVGEEIIDKERLLWAVKVANIQEFVEGLPMAYNQKIGADGHGLSMGQRQRILIARAVYKNPEYIFLDEATNALDANNEKVIMENLDNFFKGRTVVVVAHRLSTVKKADQILVIEKGVIIERGTHEELVRLRGAYFNLVKNQLELGN